MLLSSELKLDSSLIYNKYTYIRRHQSSKYHQDAVMIDSREPQKDVADMLSHSHSVEKKQNGEMIMIIMQSLLYLSRQNIALRGHDDNESNFIQLLKLRSHDNEVRRFNFIVAMSHNIRRYVTG